MTVKELYDLLSAEVKTHPDAVVCDTEGIPILMAVYKGDLGILTVEPKDQLDMEIVIWTVIEEWKVPSTSDQDFIMALQDAGVSLSDLEAYDRVNGTDYASWCKEHAPEYGLEDCWIKDNYMA